MKEFHFPSTVVDEPGLAFATRAGQAPGTRLAPRYYYKGCTDENFPNYCSALID
jgi:hypothetical protein